MNQVQTVMGVPVFEIAAKVRAKGGSGWLKRGDLAKLAGIAPAHASGILKALRSRGMAQRRHHFWYIAHPDSFPVTAQFQQDRIYNVFG